jgi:hypothetical protein|tara:strand:- start:92 stop:376 length:285 start_codon:yes stop_codon:yes gene_type:complete
MSDVIGLADVSSKDTGRGSSLKTGGMRRTYNKRRKKMPSAMKCKSGWKKMGYKSMSDCMSYGKKKVGDLNKDGKMSSYESKRSAAIQKAMKGRK